MNTATQREIPLPPGYAANRDAMDDELEKYRHLEELAKLFLAAKRHHPKEPLGHTANFR
jgi:hypothetical protein